MSTAKKRQSNPKVKPKNPSKVRAEAKPVRVGIVGLGRAGWHLHLLPMHKHEGFEIVAAADPDSARAAEAAELTGCRPFESLGALLKGSDCELVVVATPSHTHYEDIAAVLKAGRHCIAEKPMAMNTKDALKLVELARSRKRKLFVHHIHLHLQEYWNLKEVIDSGILGPIFSINASWSNYARRWDWQTLNKFGGGQLRNTCPHMLSIVLPLLGSRVENVFADLRHIKDAGDAPDHVHLVLEAKNGSTADILVSSAMAFSGPQWVICGRYGACRIDARILSLKYYNPKEAPPLKLISKAAAPNRQYLREELPWREEQRELSPVPCGTFHDNVHDVLRKGGKPVVTPESAAEVVRIIEMAYASSASRGQKA